ncbi:hypothetical protein NLJ89_g7269 [Agrocybe chaxingu]|uniref:Ribonuclease H1 N-terminal domain-containing protein n=1 Tax=Agrocybe chaxingu TaxID=84603 RepID=A0A9W8JX50_9AGAR|nr:hypothetical protein NLJ89_g7269 [Agrocybe chaxingu]
MQKKLPPSDLPPSDLPPSDPPTPSPPTPEPESPPSYIWSPALDSPAEDANEFVQDAQPLPYVENGNGNAVRTPRPRVSSFTLDGYSMSPPPCGQGGTANAMHAGVGTTPIATPSIPAPVNNTESLAPAAHGVSVDGVANPNISSIWPLLPREFNREIYPPRHHKQQFYVVCHGQVIGIFDSWTHAQDAYCGVSSGNVQGFNHWEDAVAHYTDAFINNLVEIISKNPTPKQKRGNLATPASTSRTPGSTSQIASTPGRKANPIYVPSTYPTPYICPMPKEHLPPAPRQPVSRNVIVVVSSDEESGEEERACCVRARVDANAATRPTVNTVPPPAVNAHPRFLINPSCVTPNGLPVVNHTTQPVASATLHLAAAFVNCTVTHASSAPPHMTTTASVSCPTNGPHSTAVPPSAAPAVAPDGSNADSKDDSKGKRRDKGKGKQQDAADDNAATPHKYIIFELTEEDDNE